MTSRWRVWEFPFIPTSYICLNVYKMNNNEFANSLNTTYDKSENYELVAIALAYSEASTPESKLATTSTIAKGTLLGVILAKELTAATYIDVITAKILDTELCIVFKMGYHLGVAAASTNWTALVYERLAYGLVGRAEMKSLDAPLLLQTWFADEECPKVWRRVGPLRVAMRGVRKEMSKYLGDFQFGVGVPSGAEAVLHGANRFLNKFHSDGSLAMLTVDFSNAFNLVDRTTLLHEQGEQNPLGPLLFCSRICTLRLFQPDQGICCQLLFHAWYLDDGTIIGDTKVVANAIDIIRAEGPPTHPAGP
ncbi:hypothetical protein Tco_0104859 [Tanacetum coccineum]